MAQQVLDRHFALSWLQHEFRLSVVELLDADFGAFELRQNSRYR